MTKPTIKEVCALAGISKGYACDVLIGRQDPSRPLAVFLYRQTGWKHASIEGLTEDQIKASEVLEPWVAPRDRAAA